MNILNTALIAMLFAYPTPAVASTSPNLPIVATSTSIQEKITSVFGDAKMVAILKCESKWRQFSTSTIPLMSPTHDVGISQINQVQWQEAKDKGLDIFNSLEDNLTMGKIIYDKEGRNAWTCNRLVKDV